MKRFLALLCISLSVVAFSALPASFSSAQGNEDCLMCHSPDGGAPSATLSTLETSAHSEVACVSCHADASDLPHPEKLAAVNCGTCHKSETTQYISGRHGKKVGGGRPIPNVCSDCHGLGHAILPSANPESPVSRSRIPSLCSSCHDDLQRMQKAVIAQPEPASSYMHSVHGLAFSAGNENTAVCTDCHGTHSLLPASDPDSRINRRHVPETCGSCHVTIAQEFGKSVHGTALESGVSEAPACVDCHGEHLIRPPSDPTSPVSAASITRTCSSCHEAERITAKLKLPTDRVSTYQESYHGLAARYGSSVVANCSSCHGYHDILPSSDPASSVSKANLPVTCGRCHPGVGDKLAIGYVHSDPVRSRTPVVRYVVLIYLVLIVFTIGGMFLHNLLDFLRKLGNHLREAKETAVATRLVLSERIQHFLLTITFIVLAYTGFAIKYPEALWAYPLRLFDNPEAVRGITHRVAAGIFIALCLYHSWFILATRRGREQLRELRPRFHDFRDLAGVAKYNLGLSKVRPRFERFNYIEKSEYWALVWGSVIMIVSGLILVFENLALKYFPLWVTELATVVHFFEAILATLAIIVWHFYWSVFDPHVYPMNWSWITGKSTQEQEKERK